MVYRLSAYRVVLVFFLVLSVMAGLAQASRTSDAPLILQLNWYHQFQFAGYYAALEKGFYKEEGLNVVIREGRPEIRIDEELLSGQAHFGVLSSEILIRAAHGLPLVVLAPIMQHSAYALLVAQDSDIHGPADLKGKTVMINSNKQSEFLAMLTRAGLSRDDVTIMEKDTSALVKLMSREVDAISGSIASDPYLFRAMGVSVRTIQPFHHQVDAYGDTLFTTRQQVEKNPERIDAFIRATIRGWEYAFLHQDEIIDLILTRYNTDKTREHLEYEAKALRQLVLPDLIQIGHINPERWQNIAAIFSEVGLMSSNFSLEGFLHNVKFPPGYLKYLWAIWALVFLVVVSVALAVLLFTFNKRLKTEVGSRTKKLDQMNRALIREVTERKQAEDDLRNSIQFLSTFLDTIPSPVFYKDARGVFRGCNEAFARDIFGVTTADVEGRSLRSFPDVIASQDVEDEEQRDRLLLENPGQPISYEASFPVSDGSRHDFIISKDAYRDVAGELRGIIGVMVDITQMRRVERELLEKENRLHYLKHHDALTGLANRQLLHERIRRFSKAHHAHAGKAAILIVDFDHFKQINEAYGTRVGDEALKAFAKRLLGCVRGEDLVARIGSDEFGILLEDIESESTPDVVIRRIRQHFSRPVSVQGNEIMAGLSIGVSFYPEDADDGEELVARADFAMTTVKGQGGAGVRYYREVAGQREREKGAG